MLSSGLVPHRRFLAPDVPGSVEHVVRAFEREGTQLRSHEITRVPQVLEIVEPHLQRHGWVLAQGARQQQGIALATASGPVLRADGLNRHEAAALWVETGRSWANNGYLEHLIRPSACPAVDHVVIALREIYNGPAYENSTAVIEQLIDSGRLQLPYRSVVVIGF